MYFIFDLETVPDLALIRSMLEQEPVTADEWSDEEKYYPEELSDQACIDIATKEWDAELRDFYLPCFIK